MNSQAERRSINSRRFRKHLNYIPVGYLSLLLTLGNSISIEAAQVNKDVVELQTGKPIERELKAGEVHSYRVLLDARQFLRVIVDQRGIDVGVRLFGPDEKQITEVDSPNGTSGPEPVLVISETANSYRLEIRSIENRVAPGRYEVKIEELRSATAQDNLRITAERGFERAWQLQLEGTAEALRKAIQKYEEILPTLRAIGDRQKEAAALHSAGLVYEFLGELRKALGYYSQALPIQQSAGDRVGEAETLSDVGVVHNLLGESQKALGYYNQALSIHQSVGDRRGEARTLGNIGWAYYTLGEMRKALGYYNQALPIHQSVGDRIAEAGTLRCIGIVYDSLGERQKALGYYNQALPIQQSVGDIRGAAQTLNFIGLVYYLLGETRKALSYYNQSLAGRRSGGERIGEAETLYNIGLVYYSVGEMQKANDSYAQSLLISKTVGDPSLEAKNLHGIARVKLTQGLLVEARANIESALHIIESLRTKVASPELRASYFASVQAYYSFYIDLLMQLHQRELDKGYDALALEASERARARSLLEMLTEARAYIRQGVDPALLERERSLQQLLDAKTEHLSSLLGGKHTDQQVASMKKEVEQVLTQYQEVQAQIRVGSPRYAAITQPQPLNLKQIQREVLDSDTLLLEYSLGDERSYLWAVTPDSIMSFPLPKREEIEKATRRVYELLTTRNRRLRGTSPTESQARIRKADADYNQAAEELSRMILGPAAAQFGRKRLLIVADGALSYAPFAALPVPASPQDHQPSLIAEHEIVSLPSASTLAVLRKELAGREPAPKAAAILADPVFDTNDARVTASVKGQIQKTAAISGQQDVKDEDPSEKVSIELSELALTRSASEVGLADISKLPRLPFTRQEAEAIYAMTRQAGAKKALDFEASREAASGPDMSQYRVIHFATHGLLNNEHPELSGVVLSLVDAQGKRRNGYFRLYDAYNMNLAADLVVLSACQTALGKQIRGEGLVGFARGFMYAGAARVVASLWRVEDEATAEMMKKFYEGMIKERQRPAAALRSAQVWMQKQKRWIAPYYWAGFVLQGEWK